MGQLKKHQHIIKYVLLVFVLVPLGYFIIQTDFKTVKEELNSIGLKFIYIIISTLIAYIFGTLGWYFCLGKDKSKINLFTLFSIRQIGETVGLYNPTSIVGGDLLKAELLKPYQIDRDIALNSVASSRITAILSQVLLFIISIIWLLFSPFKNSILQITGNYIYFFILLLFLAKLSLIFWLNSNKKIAIATTPATHWKKFVSHVQRIMNDMKNFFQQDPKMFWTSYFFFFVHWIIGSIELYLILLFLGFDIQVMHGVVLDMGIIIIKSFGAFVPGQIGIEEFGNKIMLAAIGISSASLWITVSILRRARQLFWILVGFILLLFIKKNKIWARNM